MEIPVFDEEYCLNTFRRLLAADSTTGQVEEIQGVLLSLAGELGYEAQVLRKGGVVVDLGGRGNTLAIAAHADDIGLMVRRINADGTLNVCPVGGIYPFTCMAENVRVYTRDGEVYTGTVCRTPNSIHVTEEELRSEAPDFRKNVCVVLDEDVTDAAGVRALGIETGDMIAVDPKLTLSNGYIKSRYIDDKACAAVVFTVMKALREGAIELPRRVLAFFSLYEEIGHGTSWLPEGVEDMLAVDIAPTGPDQNSDEHKVSIFAKDSRYPYHWEMTNELRLAALRAGVDFVMDVFTPHYGTDCDVSLAAGHDVRHAAVGPGTRNSHGYERTHVDGLRNTHDLLLAYILAE